MRHKGSRSVSGLATLRWLARPVVFLLDHAMVASPPPIGVLPPSFHSTSTYLNPNRKKNISIGPTHARATSALADSLFGSPAGRSTSSLPPHLATRVPYRVFNFFYLEWTKTGRKMVLSESLASSGDRRLLPRLRRSALVLPMAATRCAGDGG